LESLRQRISSDTGEIDRRFGLFVDFLAENKVRRSEDLERIKSLCANLRLEVNEHGKSVEAERGNEICSPAELCGDSESVGVCLNIHGKGIGNNMDLWKKLELLKEQGKEMGNELKENAKRIAELKQEALEWLRLSEELRESVEIIRSDFIAKCKLLKIETNL
jgi:hypothetical protein